MRSVWWWDPTTTTLGSKKPRYCCSIIKSIFHLPSRKYPTEKYRLIYNTHTHTHTHIHIHKRGGWSATGPYKAMVSTLHYTVWFRHSIKIYTHTFLCIGIEKRDVYICAVCRKLLGGEGSVACAQQWAACAQWSGVNEGGQVVVPQLAPIIITRPGSQSPCLSCTKNLLSSSSVLLAAPARDTTGLFIVQIIWNSPVS